MKMKNIVILGAGGFAKEVAFLIEEINLKSNSWSILGFIVDDKQKVRTQHGKYKIYSTDEWLLKVDKEINVAIGSGDTRLISKLTTKFRSNENLIFPNLIHPNAIGDWERIKFGVGNIVCAGNIFTTDITVGSYNIFNLSCTVGHDTEIGDCNVFNPTVNISGGVRIGSNILVGTGSQILQYLSICSDSTIGAGAVVTKDVKESGVYIGIPAKRLK